MKIFIIAFVLVGLVALGVPAQADPECGDARSCVCIENGPPWLAACIVYRRVLDAIDLGPCTCDPINEVLP